MKPLIAFGPVMERLKRALKVTNDKELAEVIGLKPNAFYNRKRVESIPYEEIARVANERDLRLDWVVFGVGSPQRTSPAETVPPVSVADPQVLGQIFLELERAWPALEGVEEKRRLQDAAVKGHLAAQIYNSIAPIKNEAARTLAIKNEARELGWAAQLSRKISALAGDTSRKSNKKSKRPGRAAQGN